MPHPISIRPSPYQPPTREQIERASHVERDMRMLGVLVRTLLDLSLFDPGAPGETPPDEVSPLDNDEFRNELSSRIHGLVEQRPQKREQEAAEPA